MRRVGLILALLIAATPSFADRATDQLARGKEIFISRQYLFAAETFRHIAGEYPLTSSGETAEYMLGVSLCYAGRWPEALSALDGFRTRHPGTRMASAASYWLGIANLELRRPAAAFDSLSAAGAEGLAEQYRFPSLLLGGAALESLGRDSEAAVRYRQVLAAVSAAPFFAESSYRLAGIEYRAGNYRVARDLYGRILLSYSQSPFVRDSLFFLAESELALGNLGEAEKRYRTLLALYGDSGYREAAEFRLADVAWRRGDTVNALHRLDALQEHFSDGAFRGKALQLRGDILLAQGRYDSAIDRYQDALALPADAASAQAAWYSTAIAQLALDREVDAADSLARVGLDGAPQLAESAGFQRPVLLAALGKDDEAVQALRAFVASFPRSARAESAWRLAASLQQRSGNKAGASEAWDALVNGFPRSPAFPEYLFRRGRALLDIGRAVPAMDDFQRVARDFPQSPWKPESLYALGYAYAQRGEYPRALAYFQSIAQVGGLGERSRLSIGICLFNMGSFDKALASFQALLASKPVSISDGPIVLYIGRVLYRMGRLGEAADSLSQSYELLAASGTPSQRADALYWRAWAQLRLGHIVDARNSFLSLSQEYPADDRRVEALFRAGICETLRYDDAAAVKVFDQVMESPRRTADDALREQALYERGWALSRLGLQKESLDGFERLAREYPGGSLAPQAFFRVAERSLDAQRYADAVAGFRRVADDFPKSPLALQALYWSGESARLGGDSGAALDGYWACIAARPGAGLLLAALDGFGAELKASGSLELGARYLGLVKSSPGIAPEAAASVPLDYAEMLLTSRPSESRAIIDDVRRSAPPEPYAGEATLMLGKYYAAVSDWSRALDVFTTLEGARTDEIGAAAIDGHARVLEATGSTAEAVAEFMKIAVLFPDSPSLAAQGLFDAARVARARGDLAPALRIEESLRAAYPGSDQARMLGGK